MSKLTKEELNELGIYQWEEIESKYKGSDLLLGNGFSIKISAKLTYSSIFQYFLSTIDPPYNDIFNNFGTTNFEFILEQIQSACKVNKLFSIYCDQLHEAINRLKNGLIASINHLHPRYGELEEKYFNRLSVHMDQFEDIFTTNYDTFLSRIIMLIKDRYQAGEKIRPYQDYFWLSSGEYLKFMDTQNDSSYKSVYYLHGALFIFQNAMGNFKIKRGEDIELLEIINRKIDVSEFPLFVSEGSSSDKINAINRNGYLSFCRTKFKNRKKNMVLYGFSFSAQDDHFITDLNFNRRNLAISIYCENRSDSELVKIKYNIMAQFNKYKTEEIIFFDPDTLF